jgi:hypothetical protein
MRMISPRSQHAALLGGLVVAASLSAVSQSLADSFPSNAEFLSVTPGNPKPGPAASPRNPGRGGQLLLQLRRSSGEVYGEE